MDIQKKLPLIISLRRVPKLSPYEHEYEATVSGLDIIPIKGKTIRSTLVNIGDAINSHILLSNGRNRFTHHVAELDSPERTN